MIEFWRYYSIIHLLKNQSMMNNTILSTQQAVKGFADRLNDLLEYAGYRVYGRMKVVMGYTNLSISGVRCMFTKDRPPRPQTLDLIINGLLDDIEKLHGKRYEADMLRDFLLLNKKLPWDSRPKEVTVDPLFIGMVYTTVQAIAKQESISIDDINRTTLRKICEQVILYCEKKGIEPTDDNPELADFIKSLFMVVANTF